MKLGWIAHFRLPDRAFLKSKCSDNPARHALHPDFSPENRSDSEYSIANGRLARIFHLRVTRILNIYWNQAFRGIFRDR